ncbi:MAG: spore maturation protein [Clostridia bacterium]|nr:spore maturation protein [Clostridia bacterium]
MLQWIFGGMLGASLLWGLAGGTGEQVVSAALSAAGEGVETAIGLAGGFAFFCGLMEILRRAGVMDGLARWLRPMLCFLMGRDLPEDAVPYVTMNLAANALGLGNAATPMGMEAARRMARGESAGNALCLFLVINSSSVQLLPTSVIALRAAAGSAHPGAIALPALLATGISTAVGVISCKAAEKWA